MAVVDDAAKVDSNSKDESDSENNEATLSFYVAGIKGDSMCCM